MTENYMIYPMKYMRITCRYDEGSHKNHNTNVTDGKVDYPIDDAGIDTNCDPIYCPCDEMKVVEIKGINNPSTTNTIWLVSTTPVITPTFTDVAYITLTHSNDSDFANISVGKIFRRGEIICYEGKDGAVANHIHITCGRGYCDNWSKNSNGSWVMNGNNLKPEEVFFLDKNFTKVLNSGNITWEYLNEIAIIGTPVERNNKVDQIEVLINNLNLRESYTTTSTRIGYIKKGIYNVLDSKNNEGYTWYKVENYWIASNPNWTKYYPKEEEKDIPKLIFTCNKSGKYLIYLEKNYKLYLSK